MKFFQRRRRRRRSGYQPSQIEQLELRRLLTAPTDPVVITDVEFPNDRSMIVSWDAVPDATNYEAWLSTATFNPQTLINDVFTGDRTFMSNGAFGRYEFDLAERTGAGNIRKLWVRAINDDGAGPWSAGELIQVPGGPRRDQVQFTEDRRSLYRPNPDSRLTVEWESLADEGAESYEVYVERDGERIVDLETTETSFVLENAQDDVYTVWVRGKSDVYTGPWSTRLTIGLGGTQPQITGPVRNEAPNRPEFTWSESVPGLDYQLWVQNVESGVIINQSNISGTSFTPAADLADGVYSVWVRQNVTDASPLPWSSRYRFAVGTNAIPEPPDVTLIENLMDDEIAPFLAVFEWTPGANAVLYEIQIVDRRDGTVLDTFTDIEGTRFEVDMESYPEGGFGYRGWIRSIGVNGELSDWDFVGFSVGRNLSDRGEVTRISSDS